METTEWVSVADRMPTTKPCGAGTEYSEALIVWTTGRKILTAIFDGNEFITDCAFWGAEGEEVLYWTQPEPPKLKGGLEDDHCHSGLVSDD